MIGGQEKWSTPFSADTWFNFAYDINVSASGRRTLLMIDLFFLPLPLLVLFVDCRSLVLHWWQSPAASRCQPGCIHLDQLCRFPRWCAPYRQHHPSGGLVLQRCLHRVWYHQHCHWKWKQRWHYYPDSDYDPNYDYYPYNDPALDHHE